MKFHPVVFVLIAYGITAVIAVCVFFIVKIISAVVRRKEKPAAPAAADANKGGAAS
jgi:large-conductance mechanosensitive channel